jgi:hypothetical protein
MAVVRPPGNPGTFTFVTAGTGDGRACLAGAGPWDPARFGADDLSAPVSFCLLRFGPASQRATRPAAGACRVAGRGRRLLAGGAVPRWHPPGSRRGGEGERARRARAPGAGAGEVTRRAGHGAVTRLSLAGGVPAGGPLVQRGQPGQQVAALEGEGVAVPAVTRDAGLAELAQALGEHAGGDAAAAGL